MGNWHTWSTASLGPGRETKKEQHIKIRCQTGEFFCFQKILGAQGCGPWGLLGGRGTTLMTPGVDLPKHPCCSLKQWFYAFYSRWQLPTSENIGADPGKHIGLSLPVTDAVQTLHLLSPIDCQRWPWHSKQEKMDGWFLLNQRKNWQMNRKTKLKYAHIC